MISRTYDLAHEVGRRISLVPTYRRKLEYPERIAVSFADHIRVIDIPTIMYLKAESNYTHIYLTKAEHLMASLTLKIFSDQLDQNQFLRVHQSYVVNTSFIEKFYPKRLKIILKDGAEVSVSRSKCHFVQTHLKHLMINKSPKKTRTHENN